MGRFILILWFYGFPPQLHHFNTIEQCQQVRKYMVAHETSSEVWEDGKIHGHKGIYDSECMELICNSPKPKEKSKAIYYDPMSAAWGSLINQQEESPRTGN